MTGFTVFLVLVAAGVAAYVTLVWCQVMPLGVAFFRDGRLQCRVSASLDGYSATWPLGGLDATAESLRLRLPWLPVDDFVLSRSHVDRLVVERRLGIRYFRIERSDTEDITFMPAHWRSCFDALTVLGWIDDPGSDR
jgi:hypothetical protein